MGIISKRIKTPETIIFENFHENRLANKKRVDEDCKMFNKQFHKYTNFPGAREIGETFMELNNKSKNYLLNSTGSQIFADNFVCMTNMARWYAAYFFYSKGNPDEKFIKSTYVNLRKLFDIIIFITMDHIMHEKGEKIEWGEDGFKHLVDTKCEAQILMITEVLNNIVMLADGVYDCDNKAIFKVLSFFNDENFCHFGDTVEDIFDL